MLQYCSVRLNNSSPLPADLNFSSTNVCLTSQAHIPVLYSCVSLDIHVDLFHNVYPSLCDIRPVLFDSITVFYPATLMSVTIHPFKLFVMLKKFFHMLSSIVFLPSDINTFLSFIYRNLLTHAIVMHSSLRKTLAIEHTLLSCL